MIIVTVYRSAGGYRGFEASGHAGYAEQGEDIFCAAASVLMINTVNAIESLSGDEVITSEEDGYLNCRFPGALSEGGTLLFEAMLLGLRQMEESSDLETGEPYVRLRFEEE